MIADIAIEDKMITGDEFDKALDYAVEDAKQAILDYVKELVSEAFTDYEECCVGGHTVENCPKNARNKGYFEGHNACRQEMLDRIEEERNDNRK